MGQETKYLRAISCGSRTCKPNSVCRRVPAGRSFLWAAHCCEALATYPKVATYRASTCSGRTGSPFLFGLAPRGVCRARHITVAAVRSYRTFSPLPHRRSEPETSKTVSSIGRRTTAGRYVFCGTLRRPGVGPITPKLCVIDPNTQPPGRYPARCSVEFGLSSPVAGSDRPVQLPTLLLYDDHVLMRLPGA
jgi:hypothetical protein